MQEEHSKGSDYNLPVPKSRKTGGGRVVFKPNDKDFRALLDNAYRSNLTAIIKSGLNQSSENNVVRIRNKEDSRKKVPPGTFESLNTEYGSYWTANAEKRLKLNTLDLCMTYGTLQSEQLSEDQCEVVLLEEQTKAIVVPLHRVLRRDLPSDMKATTMEKFNTALSQYSDFACIFSFAVEMAMKTFTLSKDITSILMDSIIPTEFQIDTSPTLLSTAPKYPTRDDETYMDYKNLFSYTHLQVVNTLTFGAVGLQNQTQKNHPFWTEIPNCMETVKPSKRDDNPSQTDELNVDEERLIMVNSAKQINATIKKSVVSNFSTNLENMYQSGKRFKKVVGITLKVLLKLHLQPQKERDKQKRIEELKKEVDKVEIDDIITRKKARSVLKKYRSLKKCQ
ncbi:hypothetical protein MFLAVUS_002239 [Mucor flavus]|uniref:Uncharacterized protein n=1 Tax=Mucor flavus TaxID=439312 RepID=A0ABP9YPQ8_9FUNG